MIKLKPLSLLTALMMIASPIFACDICGCGNNGNYIGILPEFQKHIFGFRYRQNGIRSHIGYNGASTYLTTKETYASYELWGSVKVAKKMNLLFSLPYNTNTEVRSDKTQAINGLGDVNLLGFYTLVQSNQLTKSNQVLIQSFRIAAGVKLPTGKFNLNNELQQTQLFTLGTGTTDFMLGGVYEVRLQNTGLNISSNVKFNTENSKQYLYGYKLQSNFQLYQKIFFAEKLSLAPNIGLQYEYTQKDKFQNQIVDISGGYILNSIFGVEFQANKYFLGMNVQLPIRQNIGNGQIESNSRWMLHLSHAF
jgi:hypothetical protein